MVNIKLSDTERLLLANQYKILSILEPDQSYEKLSEQLFDGHEWLYSQSLNMMSENLPAHEADHVLTILGIYTDLKDSYDQLDDKDGIDPHWVRFPGFDGNNEAELRGFCRALRDADRYIDTIAEPAQNSHMATTDMYNRMISAWRELGEPGFPYDKETILKILDERIHPENR